MYFLNYAILYLCYIILCYIIPSTGVTLISRATYSVGPAGISINSSDVSLCLKCNVDFFCEQGIEELFLFGFLIYLGI